MTRSASCSIEPDSRRSERSGRLSVRLSTARDSCERAITGTSRSPAITFSDLEIRHLEREDRDRDPVLDGEVRRDAECERGLAHARPARDDDEVAGLEPRRHLVDVAEAGRRAGHLSTGLVHLRDLLEALAHE